ncbi:hypothetical protein Tco_0357263 [Tanacetum coccineum]
MLDALLVPIDDQQYLFFNAFIRIIDAPEIYMQQFWHIVRYDLTAKAYLFTIDDQIFEVNADLLREALQITPKDSDHPFGRLQLMIDQDFTCFKFYEEWSQVKMLTLLNLSERISSSKLISGKPRLHSYHRVKKTDQVLRNLKFINKGEKDPIFRMPIPLVMLNDNIKTYVDYSKYLAKSKGGKPKGHGKGIEDEVDSEETKEEDEIPLVRRQTRVVIGSGVNPEVPDRLSHKSPNEGSGMTLVVLDEPRDGSSSSSLESEEEIEDISSDDESLGVDDTEKAYANKVNDDKVHEEQHMDGQSETDQPEKKSKKPKTKVDTDVLYTRLTRFKKKVEAVSKFNILEDIDKSVQAHLKKNVLPKDAPDLGKIKQEKASKQSMPKYSATPFDQASLDEYDQKDMLLKLMLKSKSYDKHPTHRALHDALVPSLLFDEDDMDKQPEDQSTSKKRRRDNNDKDKDQVGSSKKGKSPSKSTKTDKSTNAEEIIHDVEMDAGESVKEDVVDAEDPSQADANVPKSDKSTWFKMIAIERPESPDPEWHNESIVDDVPEQTWFNEMVNAKKDPPTFDDVMGLVIDFTNFTKNCLKKDRITKVDLEGPPFKLHKGKYRNYIKLNKPLPLHGASGRLTILVDFFFNKDLDYLTTGKVELKYATTLTKLKAARYDLEGIEEMIPKIWSSSKILSIIRMSDDKQFGYGYLKEIIVRCANQKEYTFKEAAFPRLHLNDIEDMYLLYTQNKLHHLKGDEQTDMVTALWFFIRRIVRD